MTKKTERVRTIDLRRGSGGSVPPTGISASTVVYPNVPGPDGLTVVTNAVYQSAQIAQALVSLTWRPPSGFPTPQRYVLQGATDSGFTTDLQTQIEGDPEASMIVKAGTLYYFRVAAVLNNVQGQWSGSVSATTASDTTAPAQPTGVAATFLRTGDLEITWTNPASSNFRDMEIRIWESASKVTLYATLFNVTGRAIWSHAQNIAATSTTYGDPAVHVELRSRSWGGVFSTAVAPGTQPTKAAPAAVTSLAHTWSGDAGTASADLGFTWSGPTDAVRYRVTLDGVARLTPVDSYNYPFALNASEHSGSADPSIAYSVVAIDAFNQSSTAVTGTATNAAPAAPTGVTLTAFFSTINIGVGSALPADGRGYRFRLIQTLPSASDVTWDSDTQQQVRALGTAATYQVGVRVVDLFGQTSTETLSSTVVADALTLADLRAEAIYSDSLSTNATTLKNALADDNRASGGISYALNASWVRWIRFERPLSERYRQITLAMAPASGTTNWYVRVSTDGSTWAYFSGPVVSSRILTSVASEAAAQSAAISSATLGNSTAARVEFPTTQEARYIEVWLRNTAAATTVNEFYPRRLVQSDDIQSEAIQTINLAAGSVTADRISVANLAAISANIGAITAGSLTAVTINSSTITGGTIQTAASGARAVLDSTGLKTYDSLGNVQVEATTATDGALRAGAGKVTLDKNGLTIEAEGNTAATVGAMKFTRTGGSLYAYIEAIRSGGQREFDIVVESETGTNALMNISAIATGTSNRASLTLWPYTTNSNPIAELRSSNSTTQQYIEVTPGGVDIGGTGTGVGGLNIGSGSGAGSGELVAGGRISAGGVPPSPGRLNAVVSNAKATTAYNGALVLASNDASNAFGLYVALQTHATATSRYVAIEADDAGTKREIYLQPFGGPLRLGNSAATLGFYGAATAVKQTVTGSRGGNAALQSLLTALATIGLITDSST